MRLALHRNDARRIHLADPVVDGGGGVAGVDSEAADAQVRAGVGGELFIEQRGELLPDRRLVSRAFEHAVVDRPGLPVAAPGHHFGFDAVDLDVDARGEQQATLRHASDVIIFAALVQPVAIRHFASLGPGQAEHGVTKHAQQPLILAGGFALLRDLAPGEPADRRVERIDVVAVHARIRGPLRPPSTARQHERLIVVLDGTPATYAVIDRLVWLSGRPAQLLHLQRLHAAAVRTRHPETSL